MTTGRPGRLEHGQRRRTRRGRRPVHETTSRPKQRTPPPIRRRRGIFQGLLACREQRAPPPIPPRMQYLLRDYWQDGAADGLSQSTPRHVDESTTLPSGSGPTCQSDALDSESCFTCQGLTRLGPGTFSLLMQILDFR